VSAGCLVLVDVSIGMSRASILVVSLSPLEEFIVVAVARLGSSSSSLVPVPADVISHERYVLKSAHLVSKWHVD